MLFSRRHPIRDDELNAYVDGELAAGSRARVDKHLEGCAACRDTVSSLRTLRVALGALPRAERDRSFVVREADVLPRATPRPAGGYSPAAQLLSGVTVMAVLAFAALVSLDAAGGRSKEATGLASSFQPSAQDSASAPDARNERTAGDSTAEYRDQQPPSLPATGPLPEATAGNPEQPPSGPFPKPTAVPQYGPGVQETTPGTEGNTSTEATPPTLAGGEEPTEQLPAGTPMESDQAAVEKTLAFASAVATEPVPTAYDRNGQFILPPVVPTAAEKGLTVETAGGSDTGLRIGEASAAAVALVAGGSLAFVWWRRRPL